MVFSLTDLYDLQGRIVAERRRLGAAFRTAHAAGDLKKMYAALNDLDDLEYGLSLCF